MKKPFFQFVRYSFALSVLLAALFAGSGVLLAPEAANAEQSVPLDRAHPQIQSAMDVQDRHTPEIMAIPEVVGTATGLTAAGEPAVLVFAKNRIKSGVLPVSVEGVPLVVEVTGEIVAMKVPAPKRGAAIDPTARFPRPVPIGVSTGNEGECSAGTIGARVKDGAAPPNVYALSNNHVYALENAAAIGSDVLQPGRFDTNCNVDPEDVIGTLAAFEPIVFSISANNTIDAAIALSSTADLGNATPTNGYGTPKSAIVPETVGQKVQKYGRTSSLTKGQITGINATVDVSYSSGSARFVKQIIVQSPKKPFIQAGDSGSLLVTDSGKNPVGLLFAGNSSGKLAVANPINLVLDRFGVTVDGQ